MDKALNLSQSLEAPITEVGNVIVHFLFTLVARLAEAVYEDWKMNKDPMPGHLIGLPADGRDEKLEINLEQLKKNNSLDALRLMADIMHNKRTSGLLRIARRNMWVSDGSNYIHYYEYVMLTLAFAGKQWSN